MSWDATYTIPFDGVDGVSDDSMADWYYRKKVEGRPADRVLVETDDGVMPLQEAQDTEREWRVASFGTAIRELSKATKTKVAYYNPYADKWVETSRHDAVVEQSRLKEQAARMREDDDSEDREVVKDTIEEGSKDDPLFKVFSDSYSIINPMDAYRPLEQALREFEVIEGGNEVRPMETVNDDGHLQQTEDAPKADEEVRTLGDAMFGEFRVYKAGGEFHADIAFDPVKVTFPGDRNPVKMGLTTGSDHLGDHMLYAQGYAQDGHCVNTMRGITEQVGFKHVGEQDDLKAWWTKRLAGVVQMQSELRDFIADAKEIEVDFTEQPFDIEGLYEHAGFPGYLAQAAQSDVEANTTEPTTVDMWTLHSGATYALTYQFRGREGSRLDQLYRIAKDFLWNPNAILQRIEESYRRELEDRDDDRDLSDEEGLVQIQELGRSLDDEVEEFEERREILQQRMQDTSFTDEEAAD